MLGWCYCHYVKFRHNSYMIWISQKNQGAFSFGYRNLKWCLRHDKFTVSDFFEAQYLSDTLKLYAR